MTEDYYKQYEPIFGAWHITRLIGEGSFGKVFEIEREDFGVVYKAALKAITIPASQSEVRSVRSEGMDEESVRATFHSKVQELVKEFALMSKLKGNSNVVSYENHQVIEHKDNIGWDILIQMELLTPLDEYIQKKKALPRQEIIKLGIDLCKALELCQKHNIIHRDIKPENTFISENGDFKLGDFGVARTIEKTTGGLSKQGSYPYMAPEIYNGKPYGTTVDIYSLGLILYRLLNGNRLPFLPPAPAPIKYADRENAWDKRFNGAPLPMPSHADGRLGEIVLKACAFEPKDRYSSPVQMRQELEAILYNKEEGKYIYPDGDEVPQDSIHSVKREDQPPIRQEEGGTVSDFGGTVSDFGRTVSDFGKTVSDFGGTVSDFGGDRAQDTKRVPRDNGNRVRPAPEKTARKKGIGKLAGIAACLLVVCVAGITLLSQGGGSEKAHPGGDTTVSGGVPISGAADGTYRVAVVGPKEFAFIDEIRTSLETQLNEQVTTTGGTLQLDQMKYNVSDQENEVLRLTQELPSQNYDVIVSIWSESCARALAEACQGTDTIVVYSGTPENAGLSNLSNVTGVTDIGAESILQAIQAVTPDAQEIGVLYTAEDILEEPISQQLATLLEENGLTCVQYAAEERNLVRTAEELVDIGVDAVYTPCGDLTDSTQEISDMFANSLIPLYTTNEFMMNCGAMTLIRMDFSAVGEQTADMVLQILQGGALPAMQQATAEFLVNQTVTEQQGMTIEEGNGISVLTMEDLPVSRDREA